MRHRLRQPEPKMTNKERFSLYLKVLREARPIWKWLIVSCLLCVIIICCSVAGPKLTGSVTEKICAYWESGAAAGGLVESVVPTLLALLGVYTLSALVRWLNMYLMNNVVSHHYTCAIRIRMSDKIQRLPVKFIGVGEGNRYGHPHASTLALMRAAGVRVLRTDTQGDLRLLFSADALGVATQRGSP